MKGSPKPLFQEITPEVVRAIQNDQFCMESNCFLSRNCNKEARIVLTNSYIALSELP
jgi:hypothetical protein